MTHDEIKAMGGWQPIETAPTMVWVLVWRKAWTTPYIAIKTPNHGWRHEGEGFYDNQPTYWAFYPEPPK